jgi:hypothetical protein
VVSKRGVVQGEGNLGVRAYDYSRPSRPRSSLAYSQSVLRPAMLVGRLRAARWRVARLARRGGAAACMRACMV